MFSKYRKENEILMEFLNSNNIGEIIALCVSVLIGTGAYLGFIILNKKQKANFKFVLLTLMINLFVTYIVSEAIKIFKFGEYRTIILPFVAYAGQYIMEWFDKRYLKIFDKGANKIGIDLNENKQQNDNDE